jgi:prepilin-type N-terminal cleavage/methylation domain-containing protein
MTRPGLRARAGFSLVELLIALLLTSLVGAAVTGVFVTQSQLFDNQAKESRARGVSRSAINIMMSELRMVEHDKGVQLARPDSLRVRVPFAMGVVCGIDGAAVAAWIFPADSFAYADASFKGYAYRQADGVYRYQASGSAPTAGGTAVCDAVNVQTAGPGSAMTIATLPAILPEAGAPIFFYQVVTYFFAPDAELPGARVLMRQVGTSDPEELVRPFDSTARFRYFWNSETGVSQATAPANLALLHGVELVLDGVNERPNSDGTYRTVPLRTAVYFKNRRP